MSITRIGTYSQIKGVSYSLPCRAATTGAITLSGTQTIDGVALVVGERVLVKNQGTGADNGIYIVASGAWSRSVDMSLNDDVFQGLQVYIISGTVNAGKVFVLSTANPITLGVTSLTFSLTATYGTSGTSGTSGQTFGTSGTSGFTGTSGTSGITGTDGSSGTSGSSGSSGSTGTSGATFGTSGTSGTSGETYGTSGSSGTAGANGVNGTSGTSGTDGSSGTSVPSGVSVSSITFPLTTVSAVGQLALGGVVAYIFVPGDPGYVAGEIHGLIAATSDLTMTSWGCAGTSISTSAAIGAGNANTNAIMAGCADAGIAARLCGDLVEQGYTDWYLPSYNELQQLYNNRVAIGNFNTFINYWSSYQFDAGNVWCVSFNTGSYSWDSKGNTQRTRAVRTF